MKRLITLIIFLLLSTAAWAGSDVTLSWDANTEADLAGYRLHYGNAPGIYDNQVDVGLVTIHTVADLPDGTYYFALTAYDTSANESEYSNEVNTALDATPPANPQMLEITIIIKVVVP